MDIVLIWLEFAVLLACIFIGSRYGGVGLGLWGSFGVFVLTYVFGHTPTSPPIDVMLIILAVIMAASVMEAAGGIDYLVSIEIHGLLPHIDGEITRFTSGGASPWTTKL